MKKHGKKYVEASKKIDKNQLYGDKPLEWFIEKKGENNMAVIIGSARIDERGKAHGGQAGDHQVQGNEQHASHRNEAQQQKYAVDDPLHALFAFHALLGVGFAFHGLFHTSFTFPCRKRRPSQAAAVCSASL